MFRKEDHSEDLIKILRLIIPLLIFFMIVFTLLALYAGYKIGNRSKEEEQPVIQTTSIKQQLRNLSDLSTAEMLYTGLITYSDDGIPYLTQTHFSMIYSARVRAGIDASVIDIDDSDETVIKITVPKATIQSVTVDPESIEFYDEQFTLFQQGQKEEVIDTISAAEADAKEKRLK